MRRISATYVFPLNRQPLKNGIITCSDNGTITEIVDTGGIVEESEGLEYYSGILVPGFVNAHCHLELSYLKNKIPEHAGIGDFLGHINRLRNEDTENQEAGMRKADRLMHAAGIVAVGDISNTPVSLAVKKESSIFYHTFAEAFGFHPSRAERAFHMARLIVSQFREAGLTAGVTPHSAYSVSDDLFRLVAEQLKIESSIVSVHNQESLAEKQFLTQGTGPIAQHMANNLKLDLSHWKPATSSIEKILENVPVTNRLLLVHNTFTGKDDIALIKNRRKNENTFFVVCPNSNLFIENKLPSVDLFKEEKLNICIGTDSLASNRSLSVVGEMITLQNIYSDTGLEDLLQWACVNGARSLEIDAFAGTLETGKKPGVNLLTGIDFNRMKLTPQTRVKRLV